MVLFSFFCICTCTNAYQNLICFILITYILTCIYVFMRLWFQTGGPDNLFVNYLSRIHREEVIVTWVFLQIYHTEYLLVLARFVWGTLIIIIIFLQDFAFILRGITRLLNNPLTQTYLPGSCKKIQFHQELLVLFWKMCDINKVVFHPNVSQIMEKKEYEFFGKSLHA